MLTELRIRDYAVVDDLSVRLGPGLNVLTGETGAGKSIVVGALSLLLGERASSTVVRSGAERATVEAVFDTSGMPDFRERLDGLGIRPEDDDHLILRREVAAEGRNRAWINGSPATAGVVGELGTALVDLHGQHDHQTLLRPAQQRAILDAFSGSEAAADRVGALYDRIRAAEEALEEREERRREVESRSDFLRFQLEEIERADLRAGEDGDLQTEADRAEHSEELVAGAAGLHERLYAGDEALADAVADVRGVLDRLAELDPSLAPVRRQVDDAYHALVDAGRRLGDYASDVDHDPARLEEVRARLDVLFRLRRKYGPELADVLATRQRLRDELADLDDADHDLKELRRSRDALRREMDEAATELSRLREDGARRLGAAVAEVLPDVGLPGGSFEARLRGLDVPGPGGAEGVEFVVALNAGFEPSPLARVASGGELSRVMLALKSVLADVDQVPVLVFDEIDAGIGGVVATAVARQLEKVSRKHQVFVVTHLPQLASRAAAHFVVEKGADDGRLTTTQVRVVEGDTRVEEIARMLGGDPESETSRRHARELLTAS